MRAAFVLEHGRATICSRSPRMAPAMPAPAIPNSRARLRTICLVGRRRMIIKRRSVPRAQRKKLRYRDEPRSLDLDPSSTRYPGRLTTEINSVNGPLQLAQLIQEHGLRFSGTQVTMALGRLAAFATFRKLTEEQAAAQARATRRCVLLLRQKVTDCDVLSYARGAYALGRLGVYDPDLMSYITEEVYDRMNLFSPDGLAALVTGFAALGHRPPDVWWDRLALEVYTRFGRFTGQELAGILYGMARLQYSPSPAWLERCLDCFRAALALPPVPPMGLAAVKFAFALASLQVRPRFNWTTAFIARSRVHLDALNARELAVLLWALSRLLLGPPAPTNSPSPESTRGAGGGAAVEVPPTAPSPPPPSPSSPSSLLAAAERSTGRAGEGADGAAAAARGALGGPSSPDPAVREAASRGPASGPPARADSGTVVAMALDRSFLDSWYRCSARRMASADAPSLVLALQALAVLQGAAQPPAKYMAALLAQLQTLFPPPSGPGRPGTWVQPGGVPEAPAAAAAGSASPRAATGARASSTGAMGGPPGALSAVAAASRALGDASGSARVGAGASVRGGGGDGGGGLGAGGAAVAGCVTAPEAAAAAWALTGTEAVSVLLSLVALRVRPGPDWMEACLAGLEPWLPGLDAAVACDLAWALTRLRYQPSPGWMGAFTAASEGLRGGGLTAAQAGVLAWAYGQLRVAPPAFLRGAAAEEVVGVRGAGAGAVGEGAARGAGGGGQEGLRGGRGGGGGGRGTAQGRRGGRGAAASDTALQAKVTELMQG